MDRSEALTLAAQPVARWLRVECGQVWITAERGGPQGDDIWLGEREALALPAGSSWVVQGWPHASVSVAVEAPARGPTVARRVAAAAAAVGGWWQRRFGPRACAA